MPIANAAYLKYSNQRISHWSLNIFPRQVVATAEIATTYSVVDYPRADFATTAESAGWLTNVYPDMLVEITRTGTGVIYRGSIRKPPVATVLYVAGMRLGDTGQVFDDAYTITDGDIVTIYSVRIPWAYWSVIDLDTRLTYRKWDLEVFYVDQPTISRNAYPQPVANLGAWQRGIVSGSVATLTHSAANSTVWRGTGFTVLWILPIGATLVGGFSLTDATIQVTYTPGVYIIGCTVTETGGAGMGRNRTAWRYVWSIDESTVKDTSDIIAISPPVSDSHTYDEGRVMSLEFTGTGAALRSVLYTGAPVLMTTEYKYSNNGWVAEVSLAAADALKTYVGYVTEFTSIADTGDIQTVTVSIANALSTCRFLGIAKQLVMVKASQNRWHKIASALGNVGFFSYYLFDQFAAWVLDFHDFDYSALDDFESISFQISGGGELEALQSAAAYVLGGTIGCASDGAIILKRDPRYESNTYNSGLDMRWTIDGDHVTGSLEYARAEMSGVFDAKGGFRISSATTPASEIEAYIARTNSGAPAQGTRQETIPDNIALSINDGLVRIGNYRQAIAAPTKEVSLSLVSMQDVIDPAKQGLYTIDLADYDPIQSRLFDERLFVARRVDREWSVSDEGEPLVSINAIFAPVNRGVPGIIELQPGVDSVSEGALTYALEFKSLFFFAVSVAGAGTLDVVPDAWDYGDITLANGRKRRIIDIRQNEVPPYKRTANIAIQFDLTIGTVVNANSFCIQLYHARSDGTETILESLSFAEATGTYEGTNVSYIFAKRFVIKGLRIRLSSCLVSSVGTPDGFCRLTALSFLRVVS